MLTAKKSLWFEKVFAVYNRNLFKRRFHSFAAAGLENLTEKIAPIKPLIIYANHSSWWDGLIAFEIARRAGLDSFILMERKQLEKLFLFRRLGAFSVVRENARSAVESINYAVRLLDENQRRALWIFPQGEILPNDARPLKFYRGAARIVEKSAVSIAAVPLAIRYEFLGEYKPEIFVKIGAPDIIANDKRFDSKELTKHFERQLTETLDELKTDVLTKNLNCYENII